MALFQHSVLNDQLRLQDEQQVNLAYKKFTSFFHNPEIQENIRSSKEEQFQATFLSELFVKILGYTMNPQPEYNLTTEFKNQKNARKADGAILKDGQAIGVIELKGTNTKHLEGIRQQAFDYKANQKGCVYVITSNFEKLRFYINDATEFLEFDLFELNREDFSLLWLCLHRENLLLGKPRKIKEASVVEEEIITKQFYKDYSVFKRELYRDLVKRNAKRLKNSRPPGYESDAQEAEAQLEMANLEKNVKQSLFKKSQKLIDRFLFIFFAEDRGLLPPNSIHKILSDWKKLQDLDAEMPLYDRFKLYFGYLDSGRKGTDKKAEIFAYNGGLFKPDPILDMLEIDDELLYRHTSRLATYDFESQVDVNILGHIFENSLNEIESVNAEIEGAEFDKQKSKRKKDGVFYTPKYITKYIVENTVGRLCEEKKRELGFREEEYFRGRKRRQKDTLEALLKILEDYREWLLQLTICDPACGSGAFLNQALDFLIKEHRYIDEMKAKLLGGKLILSDIENTILERNIYGVDINEESVEIAKLSLWLRTAQPRRKLNDLSNSIKCGNSLIDDKKIAGNKAFNWDEEFPEVFAKGGFDVVIGNPPYVRGENFLEYYSFFEDNYSVFKRSADIYSYFVEKGTNLLKENGYLSFIFPNKWMKAEYGSGLRNFILSREIVSIIDFGDLQIFSGATTYTCILQIRNNRCLEEFDVGILHDKTHLESIEGAFNQHKFTMSTETLADKAWNLGNQKTSTLVEKIEQNSTPLKKFISSKNIYRGVVTGYNQAFIISKEIRDSLIDKDRKSEEIIKPFFVGKDVTRYAVKEPDKWLIFTKRGIKIDDYPAIQDYLQKYRSQLEPKPKGYKGKWQGRKSGNYKWYEIQDTIDYDAVFEEPKLIYLVFQTKPNFTYDNDGTYVNNAVWMIPNCPKALLGIFNSKLGWFLISTYCTQIQNGYQLIYKYFGKFPIAKNIQGGDEMVSKVENLLSLRGEIEKIRETFVNFFESSIKIAPPNKKLQAWPKLEFGDFIKELNKAIKAGNKIRAKEATALAGENGDSPTIVEVPTLTKKDEFEWMELFEENKQKAQELQRKIERTDKEIDAMVYELYGLTEEEIQIIETSNE